eukprot:PITA_36398
MAQLATASASASSSTSASTSYPHYDVFINHRGCDVKETIALDLYKRLSSCGLQVFLDKPKMEPGLNISFQINAAIQRASVHIAIFSPNYADSKWCLDELVNMVNSGATIIPIFYKVKPSVVRKTGTDRNEAYARALRKHEQKKDCASDIIQNWRHALHRVADISGFELQGQGEEDLLDKIVQSVFKNLPKTPLYLAKYPTGLQEKLQEFEEIVLSQFEERKGSKVMGKEAKVVGIIGAGGVGKTTLAKHFFNCKRSNYNESSILFDMREEIAINSLIYLQSKLIKDLRHTDVEIESHDQGIEKLKKLLSSCNALIVLDDVDHVDQLDAFLPIKHVLSTDSLILVTSRDKHVLISSGIADSSIYPLVGLNRQQSRELFSLHAFHLPQPLPGFEDLVSRFLEGCDGLPLSLKVLGALVCGEVEAFWLDQLNQLDSYLPAEIEKRLRISYDSLSSQEQKIFLDIACFFVGEDRDAAIRIWSFTGIRKLENRCLLEVDSENENKIKMHDHLKRLGRSIAREASMPRRLWHQTTNNIDYLVDQSSRVVMEVHGIAMVRPPQFGNLVISSEMPRIKRWRDEVVGGWRNLVRFRGIRSLQLVAIEDCYLERILRRTESAQLTWLRWYKCPYNVLPAWIMIDHLRVLEVAGSRLNKLWPQESEAPFELRELNVRAPLSEFPKSIGYLRHLEKIVVRYEALAITTLPDEIGNLRSLKHLEIRGCSRLKSLPDSLERLTNLEHIDLFDASSLLILPISFGTLTRLKHLALRGCRNLSIFHKTLGNITTLEYLDLRGCIKVTELPPQLAHQRSLEKLYLYEMNFKALPFGIGRLGNLKVLKLGSDSLEVLPPSVGGLKSLKNLRICTSPELIRLPDAFGLLTQLTELKLFNCGIQYLPRDILKMNNLEILEIDQCPVRELPFQTMKEEVGGLILLKQLHLLRSDISTVSFPVSVCPNLRHLTMDSCKNLVEVGDLPTTLKSLFLLHCNELTQIGGLDDLEKLQRLDINGCHKIEELPNLERLVSLQVLCINECHKLKRLSGLEQLNNLKELVIQECHEIEEAPGVEELMGLKGLNVRGCPKLRWDEGVIEQLREQLGEELYI